MNYELTYMAISSNDVIHIMAMSSGSDDGYYWQWNSTSNSQIGPRLLLFNSNVGSANNRGASVSILDNQTIGIVYSKDNGGLTNPEDLMFRTCNYANTNCSLIGNWSSSTLIDGSANFDGNGITNYQLTTNGTEWFLVFSDKNSSYSQYQGWYMYTVNNVWQSYEVINPNSTRLTDAIGIILKDNIPMVVANRNTSSQYMGVSFTKRESGS
jgi:hypothetical protein